VGVCVIVLGKNKFILHFTFWATKEFQSPFNNGGMSDGNQIFFGRPKRHGREGHEMVIRKTRGGKKENKRVGEKKRKKR
jgi:hypothetical protein